MWAEWTAYVACSVVYILLLRSLTIASVYEMNCTMYIFGAELCKLLLAVCIYTFLPDAKAGSTAAEKWRSLARHWKEGFRFASVGMAYAVFSSTVVLDTARLRPPLHRIVVATRPFVTAAILQYTNGGRIAWDARHWTAMGLLTGAGMVLPLYDWYAGETLYHAFAVAFVGLVEVTMFSGANAFLEHLFSKRQGSVQQEADAPVGRLATDWQQAVYLTASSSFIAFLIFEAATPVRVYKLTEYWLEVASWLPYATMVAGGCCGVCQIVLMRSGGSMAKELALTLVVPLSALFIQLAGSLEPIQEISVLPIAFALLLAAAAAAVFPTLRPVSTTR